MAFCLVGCREIVVSSRFLLATPKIRFGAKVERIVLEDDTVIGLQLEGGEAILSDWVIATADGHAAIC